MDPMSSLVKSFLLVLQHEREFLGLSPTVLSQDTISFMASAKGSSSVPPIVSKIVPLKPPHGRNTKFCENYKNTNHTFDTYYWRIDFPPSYRKSNRASGSSTISSTALANVDPATTPKSSSVQDSSTQSPYFFSKEQH